MTFEVLYNEAHGSVKTAEIDANCLLEAEAKFKEAHPEATYWEIGIEIEADSDYDSNDVPVEHICVKCLKRKAIVNKVCGMCSELHPYMV